MFKSWLLLRFVIKTVLLVIVFSGFGRFAKMEYKVTGSYFFVWFANFCL